MVLATFMKKSRQVNDNKRRVLRQWQNRATNAYQIKSAPACMLRISTGSTNHFPTLQIRVSYKPANRAGPPLAQMQRLYIDCCGQGRCTKMLYPRCNNQDSSILDCNFYVGKTQAISSMRANVKLLTAHNTSTSQNSRRCRRICVWGICLVKPIFSS